MSLRPTVIGGSTPAAAPKPPTPMPTSMPVSAPVSPSASPPAPAPRPALPTAVPAAAAVRPAALVPTANPVTKVLGVERQGLRVDPAALALRHPGASTAAVEEAAAVLAGVVPGHHPRTAIEQLGRGAQESVARLVERALRTVDDSDDAAPRTAHRHTARLLELLGELAEVLRPSGVVWWRKPWRRTLAERRPEIDALRGLLAQSEAALIDRREKLLALQDEAGRLLDSLSGSLIAVTELRPVFDRQHQPGHLDSLDSRENELAKSAALLQSHRLQMQRVAADYTRLAERIRDAVLHALPAWLSVASASPDDGLTDTQRYTLSDQLHALIRGLSPAA